MICMKKIIIFDLDETLYDESYFVKLGFQNVSQFLKENFSINKKNSFNFMNWCLNKYGRNGVFNKTLIKYNIFTVKTLKKCISIYRYDYKSIKLRKDAIFFLKNSYIKNLYLVTDGNKKVQQKKIDLLDISKYFKKIFITHNYGLKYSKPSLYCFKKICNLEKCNYKNLVYIADDPNKDFINLNKMGALTIRLLKGRFANLKVKKNYDGFFKINSLVNLNKYINR